MTRYRINQRTSRRFDPEIGIGLIVVLLALVIAVLVAINSFHTQEHTGCVVSDKDRTTHTDSEGNNSSDARIYTDNCGTFQVADSWLSWTFSSADTYGSIKVGKIYDFTSRGYRIPFFSAFPNIVEVREVK